MSIDLNIEREAANFKDKVAVTRNFHALTYIGERSFLTIGAAVAHAFAEGARWAQELANRTNHESLAFRDLREQSRSRVARWHGINDWSPLEWAGAMCGEAGEAANVAKKLKRLETGILNPDKRLGADASMTRTMQLIEYATKLGLEVADTVIYGDLLCQRVSVDLEASIREAFNQKSIECGFPERL